MAIWKEDRNKNKRNANNFSNGLNTVNSPFFVDENTVIDGYGFDFEAFPAIQVRGGRTNYGPAGDGRINLLTSYGNKYLVRSGRNLTAIQQLGHNLDEHFRCVRECRMGGGQL